MDSERFLTNPKTRTATPAPGARRTRIPTPIRIQGKPGMSTATSTSSTGRTTPSGRITPVPKGSGIPYRVDTRDPDRTASRAASRASSLTLAGVKTRPTRAATPMAMTRPGEFRPGGGLRKGGSRVTSKSGRSFSMPTRPNCETMDQVEVEQVGRVEEVTRVQLEEVKKLNVLEVKVEKEEVGHTNEHISRHIVPPDMPTHMTHTPPPEDTSVDSFVSAPEEPRSYSMGDLLTSHQMLTRDRNDSTTSLQRENPISRRHSLTVSLTETDSETVLLRQQFKTVAIETVTGGEPRDPTIHDTLVTCSPDHVIVSTGSNHMTYPTCLYTWTLVDQKLSNPYLLRHKLKYALVAIPIPVSGMPNLSRSVSRVSLESSRTSIISVDDSEKRRSSFGRLKSLLRKKDKEVIAKPYTPSSRDKPEYSLVLLFDSKASQQMWKEKLGYMLEGDAQNRLPPVMTRHRPHTPPQDEDLGFKVDRDRLRSYMDVGGWSKLVRKRDSVIETSDKSEKRDSKGTGSLRKSRSFKNFRESFYSSKTVDLEEPDTTTEARDDAKDTRAPKKESSGEEEKHGDGDYPCLEDAQERFSTPLENVPADEGASVSVISAASDEQTTLNDMFRSDEFYRQSTSSLSQDTDLRDSSHLEVDLSRDVTLKRRPQGIVMAREVSEGTVREGETYDQLQQLKRTSRESHGHDPLSRDSFSYDIQRHDCLPRESPTHESPQDEWTRLSTYTLNTTNSSCPITPVTPVLDVNHVSPVIAFSANTTPPINMLHTVPSNVSTAKSVSNHHHLTYSDHMGYSDHVPHVPPLKTPLWLPGHSRAKSDIRAALARDRGGSSTPVTPMASTADLLSLTRDRSSNDMVSLKSREFQLKNTTVRPRLHKTVSNPCLVDATDEAEKMNKISSEAARLWLKRRQSVSSISLAPPVSLQQLVKEPAVRKMTKNVYNGQLPGWHALSQASSRVPGVPVPKA
ncbi:hypothetical protein B0I72DRAFT_143343 [Yarrowia lipolytica]|nr:hypothetical protein B0I72DRAFT_143343 [Yarrowia lipolytica]RDW36896.1 hypothetical protein B0I73DRAFT_136405 [Yarrowia lipolytica]